MVYQYGNVRKPTKVDETPESDVELFEERLKSAVLGQTGHLLQLVHRRLQAS